MAFPFPVGAAFRFAGLPGQDPDPATLTVTGCGWNGTVVFTLAREGYADVQTDIALDRALLLVEHGLWVPA